jgi:probable rRNA maturation factor
MSVVVEVAVAGVSVPLSRDRIADTARRVLRAERVWNAYISITFVTTGRMMALNKRHLHRTGTTDVISFGFAPLPQNGPVIGDIYISPAAARRNAREQGVSIPEELVRLVVHGVLHAVGLDHPEGPERTQSPMWRRQEALVRRIMRTHTPGRGRKGQAREWAA